MALYFYQAFTKEGKKISGYLDAASTQEVKDRLAQKNAYPIKVEIAREGARQSIFARLFAGGVTPKDKILFTKQLSVLLKSGIPLLQSLELLLDQFTGTLRTMLVAIKDDIKEGSSFADAIKKYPKVFDNIYVQLVRAGEASGKLEMILERLTEFLERKEEMRQRIKSALRYPLIQLGFAVIVVGVMLVWVVPQMVGNFAATGQELPTPTKILIAISDVLLNHYLILILAITGIVIVYKYWSSTPSGSRILDQLKLKIPGIRYFARMNAVVQFSQTLGMLIEGGVNLSEALDIVVEITSNRILKDKLNEARDKIIKQGKIAQYLKETNLFPPIAIHLIKTGEESGQLDFMLLTVAKNYETDLKEAADSLSANMSPILLAFMAIVIGFIVIAIAVPIMQMSGGFS